jgi:hypothetical protein
LWQYSFYVELCDCYRGRLWEYSESAKLDWQNWRDWIDIAISAEQIGRGLEAFAGSLRECLDTQSYDIPLILRLHFTNICSRISRRPQKKLDVALEQMLGHAEDSYFSVEEQAAMKAAHDQLQKYVNRHREQIAAAHNPEASSGKSPS